MADILSQEKRNKLMARVKNKNTNIELILRKRFWAKGIRYRINYKIFGSPDIAFPRYKVAVFCDGDFWHGRKYKSDKIKYKPFWQDKIAVNIKRDRRVNMRLKAEGWNVIRFWKTDILKKPDACVKKILKYLE